MMKVAPVVFLLAVGILSSCQSTCSPSVFTRDHSAIVLRGVDDTGLVADYFKMRGIATKWDARGLVLPYRPDTVQMLKDLSPVVRAWKETIENNILNRKTTSAKTTVVRDGNGNAFLRHRPFVRQAVILKRGPSGTPIVGIEQDAQPEFHVEYDPAHRHSVKNPEARDFGWVYYPNMHPVAERIELMLASTAFESIARALDELE